MLASEALKKIVYRTLLAGWIVCVPALAAAPLSPDALSPEGRSRWDLSALPAVAGRSAGLPPAALAVLRPGESRTVELGEARLQLAGRGVGWAELPEGPREVTLLRVALELRADAADEVWAPVRHGYAWLDGDARVLASILWEGAPNDWSAPPEAMAYGPAGVADLKIYSTELATGPYYDISYGWDRGKGTAVSALTTPGYATAGELIAASTWDFSINTSGTEVSESQSEITAAETCNLGRCGYGSGAGWSLQRTDKSFDSSANLRKDNQSVQYDTSDPAKRTLWLRAGRQNEGKTGAFGSGETGYCFTTDGSGTRTPVPLYLFGHQDAKGYYFAPGDAWAGGPFNCEQNVFNQTCGTPNLFDKLYTKACGTHTGKQGAAAIKNGVIKVPSGHTFNVMLVKVYADFCVYSISGCSAIFKVDEVRTINYQWMAPILGTVARIRSGQNVPDENSWTTVEETNIKFGLWPPLSITVTGQTNNSLTLSWDPGLLPHRISRYKVYWDTDSGSASGYAFNSQTHPGQVSFSGTSATISGLAPGASYYVTVTSLSDFRNPSTGVTRTYESLVYPTQVFGDPDKVYPVEVLGTTAGGCAPTQEVQGLRITRQAGGTLRFCWNAVTDACLAGYRILGSDDATSAAGWNTVADVGNVTCWDGSPARRFYLVQARGGTGTGPWGHYGR
jgi:hypothetical protein